MDNFTHNIYSPIKSEYKPISTLYVTIRKTIASKFWFKPQITTCYADILKKI